MLARYASVTLRAKQISPELPSPERRKHSCSGVAGMTSPVVPDGHPDASESSLAVLIFRGLKLIPDQEAVHFHSDVRFYNIVLAEARPFCGLIGKLGQCAGGPDQVAVQSAITPLPSGPLRATEASDKNLLDGAVPFPAVRPMRGNFLQAIEYARVRLRVRPEWRLDKT